MPAEESANKTNIRDFNPFLSIIRPFTRTLEDGRTFSQEIDGREFTDYQEILHEELLETEEMQNEQKERYSSTVVVHVKKAEESKNHSNSDKPLSNDKKEEMLEKIKDARLLGKVHSTIDKQEVEAVESHIGEPVDETNSIFDLNEDGVIDNKDVDYVRVAIRWQYEKANVLIDDSTGNNIEDLVKFTIRPTSGNVEVYFNNKKAPAKAIAVYPGTTVTWKVISCGKYTEEGEQVVTEQKTLTVMIEEDCAASRFCAAAQYTYGGHIHLTEDVSKGVIAQTVSATGTTIIDMGGHSYHSTDTIRTAILVRGSSQYSISNAGTISSDTTSMPLATTNSASCTLTINDGEWISGDLSGECIYAQNGIITINGGTFKNSAEGSNKYLLNCYDSSWKNGTAKIIVKGGRFYNFDPANSNDGSFLAPGYKSELRTDEEGNIYYEVIPE